MDNSQYKKDELEALIAKEWTLGKYTFDEGKKCFWGDAEVELCLKNAEGDKYIAGESYFFDGYEIGVSDEDAKDLVFYGLPEMVKVQAIERFNATPALFMGYPIYYNNVSVEFVEE